MPSCFSSCCRRPIPPPTHSPSPRPCWIRSVPPAGFSPRARTGSAHIDGLGEAGVCAIKAAEALGIRLARGELPKRLDPALHNYDKAVEYCRTLTGHRPIEEFHVLFLDTANRLIRGECHQTGTINHAPAYPREICRRALELHSTAVLLSHNHPSGNVFPSNSDIEMTGRIQKALKTIDVTLHDHLIVTAHDALSFKARGLL